MDSSNEEELLRSVALKNAASIRLARQRAETQLLEAQIALRESRERLQAALSAGGMGTFRWDVARNLVDADEHLYRIFGLPTDAVSRSLEEFFATIHVDDRARVQQELDRVLSDKTNLAVEFRVVWPDGSVHWVDDKATIISELGTSISLIGACVDITARKHAEETLRESAERLHATFHQAAVGIAVADLDGRFLDMNDKFASVLGFSRTELQGLTFASITHPEDAQQTSENVQQLLSGEIPEYVMDKRYIRKDGDTVWSRTTVTLIKNASGQAQRFVGVIEDITSRKAAEAALTRSEGELRTLANSIPQLAWMAEPDGSIFWYNEGWYAYTGTTLEQVQGWGWQQVHDDKVLPRVLDQWNTALQTGEQFDMEYPLRGANGTFRWFLTRVNPMRDTSGKVVRWFGTNTDVDQVKHIREALEDETRVLELLNETGSMLASKLDVQSLVQAVTDAGTKLSGAAFGAFFYNTTTADGDAYMLYTLSGAPREAFGKFGQPRATALFGPTFKGQGPIRLDDVLQDARYGQFAPHHGMPTGHPSVRSYLAVPVISRSGEVIGGLFFGHPQVGVFTARTERLVVGVAAQAAVAVDNARLYDAAQQAAQEREKLLDSERLARAQAEHMSAMKDEFLATLSHELRTPLSAILGWSQVLRHAPPNSADLARGLDTIERNARVQQQLIEDLLDMSRITSGKLRLDIQSVSPAAFVEAALETIRPAANAKGIRLEPLLDPTAGPISGDPNRLQQVTWNVLSNAVKFTPKGGKVQVVLERVNSHIEISVADTGAGINAAFLPHVFERFRQADATTTRQHGGLGLGLSIVRHLMELHGGSVRITSPGEGQGATVTLLFPLKIVHATDEGHERQHPKGPSPAAIDFRTVRLDNVSVLVVDDHADARELVKRVLMECGATVYSAGSAHEALQMVEQHCPHVLVSDIGMPDVDGYELLHSIRALGADRGGSVPAIALTAFARSEDRTRALRAGFLVHVSKPVEASELVATVASVVGRSGYTR